MDTFQDAARHVDAARTAGRHTIVPVRDLRTGLAWSRPLDETEVRNMADWALHLPAIVISADLRVVDGHRRLAALRRAGLSHVEALILFDGLTDTQLLEVAALLNTGHGSLPARRERIDLARRLMAEGTEASDRALARQLRLGRVTITTLRRDEELRPPSGRPTGPGDQLDTGKGRLEVRRGSDGRGRPVDPGRVRELIAAEIDRDPDASARMIARRVGCSPTTVTAVRRAAAQAPPPAQARPWTGPRMPALWLILRGVSAALARIGRHVVNFLAGGGQT